MAEIKGESQSYYSHFAKGIGALSALAGGALYTPNDVQAEELPVGYEMTEETLVETDIVVLTDEEIVIESADVNINQEVIAPQVDTEASTVQSESELSESSSEGTEETESESETKKESESEVVSESEVNLLSDSISLSTSESEKALEIKSMSLSESESVSTSESLSESLIDSSTLSTYKTEAAITTESKSNPTFETEVIESFDEVNTSTEEVNTETEEVEGLKASSEFDSLKESILDLESELYSNELTTPILATQTTTNTTNEELINQSREKREVGFNKVKEDDSIENPEPNIDDASETAIMDLLTKNGINSINLLNTMAIAETTEGLTRLNSLDQFINHGPTTSSTMNISNKSHQIYYTAAETNFHGLPTNTVRQDFEIPGSISFEHDFALNFNIGNSTLHNTGTAPYGWGFVFFDDNTSIQDFMEDGGILRDSGASNIAGFKLDQSKLFADTIDEVKFASGTTQGYGAFVKNADTGNTTIVDNSSQRFQYSDQTWNTTRFRGQELNPISISYTTETGNLSVNYANLNWSTNISNLGINKTDNLNFAVTSEKTETSQWGNYIEKALGETYYVEADFIMKLATSKNPTK